MNEKLEELLRVIAPENTVLVHRARADDALNSFWIDAGTLDGTDFQQCLSEFFWNLDCSLLGVDRPFNSEADWALCTHLLHAEYGRDGIMTAHRIAATGTGGGLLQILRRIANRKAEDLARSEIQYSVSMLLDSIEAAEYIQYAAEYTDAYRGILPLYFAEDDAIFSKLHFRSILEQHPFALLEFKSVRG